MTHLAYIPIDDGARTGHGFCLQADDETLHAGHWDMTQQAFVYGPGQRIQKRITHYCARLPGNPSTEERTA